MALKINCPLIIIIKYYVTEVISTHDIKELDLDFSNIDQTAFV